MMIHMFWGGPTTSLGEWVENTVKSLHPSDELKVWGPGDYQVDTFQVKSEDVMRHISNVTRYKALNDYGGLWLDHDVVPLCNLFEATKTVWVAGLGLRREGCAMRFTPNHPFLQTLLSDIETRGSSSLRSTDVSGAGLMNRVHHSVPLEQRILPFDAMGNRTHIKDPIAVHLWVTSFQRQRTEKPSEPVKMGVNCTSLLPVQRGGETTCQR